MAFAFPQLTMSELVVTMSDLCNIHIDENAFKKPDGTQWQQIFGRILCEVTDAPEDSYLQQPLLTTEVEYPDLHTDSFPLMHLTMCMQRIMQPLSITDFSGGDIISPSPQRLRKICSAVINFLRFKNTRVSVYDDIRHDIEQDREHHETLLKRNEELKQKINRIRAERAQQEPEVAKVQDEIEQITLRMQEHQRNKQMIQKTITDIKTRVSEKIATADQLKCAILKAKEDGDKLSNKIVQSPEKVRAEQDNLQHQLVSLKDMLERKRHRLSELQQQRDSYKQSGLDAEKGLQLLESIQASINKENEIVAQMGQIMDKIQDHNLQTRDLNNKKGQLQHLFTTRQEKLAKLSLQHQCRMKVLQEQFEMLKEEKESCLQKQNSDSVRKHELLEYKKKMEEEVKKEHKLVEQRIGIIMDMYRLLLEKLEVYHSAIVTNWDEIRQILKS